MGAAPTDRAKNGRTTSFRAAAAAQQLLRMTDAARKDFPLLLLLLPLPCYSAIRILQSRAMFVLRLSVQEATKVRRWRGVKGGEGVRAADLDLEIYLYILCSFNLFPALYLRAHRRPRRRGSFVPPSADTAVSVRRSVGPNLYRNGILGRGVPPTERRPPPRRRVHPFLPPSVRLYVGVKHACKHKERSVRPSASGRSMEAAALQRGG